MSQHRDLAWGRYFNHSHTHIALQWRHQEIPIDDDTHTVLPHGMGRSYGDSCLNANATLLETRGLKRFIGFDRSTGILRCEAGVTLAEIIQLVLPQGWFLMVTPGTKFATVGGAIANDVHGKNHHRRGTFGCHVRAFELLRSDGERMRCSATDNASWYQASIGGLGLTGLITWAELQLMPVHNAFLSIEEIRYHSLDEFLELNQASKDWEYTVAWADCLAQKEQLGRGVFVRANHAPQHVLNTLPKTPSPQKRSVPFALPSTLLNNTSIGLFNQLYWRKNGVKKRSYTGHYDAFFYPLDAIHQWNRIYGNRGFLQYQFVVPHSEKETAIRTMMRMIADSGKGSFLSVLKTFADIASPGMMSFPRPGVTFALDFPNRGDETLALLKRFDRAVMDFGGCVYPAKDARMSSTAFKQYYPQWQHFASFIDPHFTSSFWKRVMETSS